MRRTVIGTLIRLSMLGLWVPLASAADIPSPPKISTGTSQDALIADQSGGGAKGFYWNPPIAVAAAPAFTTLDPAGQATVKIDRIGTNDTFPIFTNVASLTGSQITIWNSTAANSNFPGAPGPFYGATWTPSTAVKTGERYRIRVQVGTNPVRELGVADVMVFANQTDATNIDRAAFVPMIAGAANLKLTFRLEARDGDADTVNDWNDNCPASANTNQTDTKKDGIGDACRCLNVTCVADACHTGGTCSATTGCPVKTGSCNDGNSCTTNDTCQAGVCKGTNVANGATCNDGNACTNTDRCQAGICTGTNVGNGTSCSDANACTQTDTCQTGRCMGVNLKACPADQCHLVGTCTPATGVCVNPNKPEGTACTDSNMCTSGDTCQMGACKGNAVTCTTDQCHTIGACVPVTGCPAAVNKPNGSACMGTNPCTQNDTCQMGACRSGPPKTCTALDQCHVAGQCNPQTGSCSNPSKPDGVTCNDNSVCTRDDACQAGTCTGAATVICAATDSCHDAGVCNPRTGSCSSPRKTGGTCGGGPFEYDRAGRLVQDQDALLVYDGYDQLTEVRPIATAASIGRVSVDDLGPGSDNNSIFDVNSTGQAVGTSDASGGMFQSVTWTRTDGPVDFDALLGFPGLAGGTSINNLGTIAGAVVRTDGAHAIRYSPMTGMQDLGKLGNATVALGINDANQTAGIFLQGLAFRGFRHTDAGGFHDIATLGGVNTYVFGIDPFGTVVGASQRVNSPTSGSHRFGHAIIYNDVVGLFDLNVAIDPGLGWELILATKSTGEVIVGAGDRGGKLHPFRYRPAAGTIDDLGLVGAGDTFGMGVNGLGDVVGWGFTDAAGTQKAAFVYNDVVKFQLLNNLIDPASGWNLQMAQAINDAGDVVGWGIHNGQFRGFHIRIPLPHNTPGAPKAKVLHTTGYDGLRTTTTTAPGTPNAKTQFWFSQDYTEHDGQREHYVRVGNRIVARETMIPDGALAAAATTQSPRQERGEAKLAKAAERFPLAAAVVWILALAAVGLGGLLGALRRPRRRRWTPATAALLLVTLPLASCQLFGLNQEQSSALWKVAPDATLYFHQGGTAGPSIITKSDATIFEERRYEPFGQPIDAYRDGVGVTTIDFLRDPQNSLGKMTDPTTGWSYHGARWMMPQTGRWTSPDPAIKGPSRQMLTRFWLLHPYTFVLSNPMLYWDPDGYEPQFPDLTDLAVKEVVRAISPALARIERVRQSYVNAVNYAESAYNDFEEGVRQASELEPPKRKHDGTQIFQAAGYVLGGRALISQVKGLQGELIRGPTPTVGAASNVNNQALLRAQLKLEQTLSNGKFLTTDKMTVGSHRIAVFDAQMGKMIVGAEREGTHLGLVERKGLPIEEGRYVGGWVDVTSEGGIKFSPVSGTFPIGETTLPVRIEDRIRGTGVSM